MEITKGDCKAWRTVGNKNQTPTSTSVEYVIYVRAVSLLPGVDLDTFNFIPAEVLFRWIKIFGGAAVLYVVLRLLSIEKLFVEDADGIGTLVHIIGTLYSVLYAFATYVIWGQFTAVENEILKESGSLKNLLVFSRPLPEKERDPIVRAVKTYARSVVETEWGALSRKEETEKTDRLFLQIVSSVAEIRPEDDTQRVIFERLLEIANQASAHRDERLALSLKRMPRTLFLFVSLTAFMILVLVLIYPFHSFALGLASVAITTALLLFAHFVLSDLDNPFEGTWNAGNEPFGELITRFS